VVREFKAPIGHYKTGSRAGEVKYKTMEHPTDFPRLVQPLTTSEFGQKKEDTSVSEGVLRSLKPNKFAKHIIDLILERSKLEKMNGTYLKGLPKKMDEFQWGEFLHPSYNQCVAVTGRIASSNPNGQNIPSVGKQLCESRY
jgi:DNA polymerase I-like protein with 3'-5' exonuclease and polymerase domains